jgi:hypothetical protein
MLQLFGISTKRSKPKRRVRRAVLVTATYEV